MENNSERGLHKIVLRANQHIDKDTIFDLRGTKAIRLEDMSNTDEEYDNRTSWSDLIGPARPRGISSIEVTTWSSLVRNAIDIIKPQLDYVLHNLGSFLFKATFEACLKDILDEQEFKPNSNFPKRLFKEAEETDLIKSSVYLNNKNHLLKLFDDEDGIAWYVCAVYTGEIIWVLEALLDTIYSLMCDMGDSSDIDDRPHHTLVLSYIDRTDILDSQHTIAQVELNGGAELHRFKNNAGVDYSAIYVGDNEMMSCERYREQDMIEHWNNTYDEDINEIKQVIDVQALERDIIGVGLQLKETILSIYGLAKEYNLTQAEDIIRGIYAEDMPKELK